MIVVFDADCGLCSYSVQRWKRQCDDGVRFIPFDEFDHQEMGLDAPPVRGSVLVIEPDGKQIRAAAAALRVLHRCGRMWFLYWMYRRVPGFAWLSEWFYRRVAANRQRISRWLGLKPLCSVPRKP